MWANNHGFEFVGILIVNDNDDNRYTLQLLLESDGHEHITSVSGGNDAIALLDKTKFHLVLLDMMMPDLPIAEDTGGSLVTRILYIEDNDDNVYMLQMRFELLEGSEFLVAADGAIGVEKAMAELPDVILMDLDLPVIDGWEATRRIKSDAATQHIPIIALTAHAMSGSREKALAAGCDEFDTKPIDFDRLMKVDRLLAKNRD